MSFTNKILKTYFWQFSSNGLKFVSMFIIAPYLTRNPAVYGVYMVCMSTLILFSFADFGFWNATLKFSSEFVGKKDFEKESDVIGFSLFINFLFMACFMVVYILFVVHPTWLMKDMASQESIVTARKLLILLIINAPIKVIGRAVNVVLSARVSIYVLRRLYMASSLLTIFAVFIYFSNNEYNIVGYFIFQSVAEFVALMLAIRQTVKKFNIDLWKIIKKIRYNKNTFNLMKKLAGSSVFTSIAWIFFANFDLIFIGKMIGAHAAAVFGIALNLYKYIETFIGSNGICGPFLARFNHIVGSGTDNDLKEYLFRVNSVILPLVIFPVTAIIGMMTPFVNCWVGSAYTETIPIASILLMSFLLHFIAMPVGYIITAKNRAGILMIITIIMLVFYWVSIALLLPKTGVISMPLAKTIANITSSAYSIVVVWRMLSIKKIYFMSRVLLPAAIAGVVCYLIARYIAGYLPETKSKINLLTVLLSYSGCVGILIALYGAINPYARKEFGLVFNNVIKKKET